MATYTRNKPGHPTAGKYTIGDNVPDSVGVAWKCVRTGRPGTWVASPEGSSSGDAITTAGVGAKNGSTVSVVEYGAGGLHKTVLTLTATPISVTDDAGVAQYGGVKVYTFPAGLIFSQGAVLTGNLTLGVTGTIIAAFTGVNALGTVTATTGATLVAGEATWLQSTANATASAAVAAVDSVSIATALTESGGRHFDGTATAAEMYLNFAIADDASHTSGTGTFTGTISFVWVNLGDN